LHHGGCLVGNHFHIHRTTVDLSRVVFINCSEGIIFVCKMNLCGSERRSITIVVNHSSGNGTHILENLKAIIFSELWIQISEHNAGTSG